MLSVKEVDLTNNGFKYYLPVSTKTIYNIIIKQYGNIYNDSRNQFLGAIKVNTDVQKKKKIINSSEVQFSYCKKKLD